MNFTTNNSQDTIEYGYCHCGCGRKANLMPYSNATRGFTKGKPFRFILGHGSRRPLGERFWEKVDIGVINGCWIWTGSTMPSGYGQVGANGKLMLAHRASWELANGPIPDGLFVLHKCDNPSCVRVSHLFLGTHQDNADDRERKGRGNQAGLKGEKNPKAKLVEKDISHIRKLCADGITKTAVGKMYGVTDGTICNIINGKTWTHVP